MLILVLKSPKICKKDYSGIFFRRRNLLDVKRVARGHDDLQSVL